jgi:hypothetical protein
LNHNRLCIIWDLILGFSFLACYILTLAIVTDFSIPRSIFIFWSFSTSYISIALSLSFALTFTITVTVALTGISLSNAGIAGTNFIT